MLSRKFADIFFNHFKTKISSICGHGPRISRTRRLSTTCRTNSPNPWCPGWTDNEAVGAAVWQHWLHVFWGFIAFFVFHRVFSNPGGPARFFPALGFCSKVKQNIINPSISGYPHKPISASQVESLQSSETAPCGDSLIGLDRVPARSSPMCPMLKFGALGALGLPILKPWNATWVLGQTRCFGETKLACSPSCMKLMAIKRFLARFTISVTRAPVYRSITRSQPRLKTCRSGVGVGAGMLFLVSIATTGTNDRVICP